MTFPPDFIDREEEIHLLEETLSKKRSARLLVFLIKPEHGKTYLMSHFHDICRTKAFPVTLVDFDQRGKDPISYWKFVSNIRDDLGDKLFKNVNTCENRHRGEFPLIKITVLRQGGVVLQLEREMVEL